MLDQAPVKQPSSKPKSELLQRAEKLAEDTAALAQRVQCEDLRAKVRSEHAEWATATFGNTGPIGPLKHLSAEALEAAAAPDDLSEWADMQFLFWDAQRRAGITDEQITQAMIEKLAVNKQREWPEPKDGEPRLHIKERAAPVVTFYRDGIEAAAKWIDQQREAYDSEHGRHDQDTGSFEFGNDAQREYSSTLEELAEGIRGLHPNAGNSPAIPDGYVLVPKEARKEILDEFDSIIDYGAEDSVDAWHRLLAAATRSR
ncbi:dATP/dGTP pyrophosphohydrolase domain-containing protein [Klebsiella pneumoniae]|uniref:dATP/dGTP pyrophosphohydrolase domain-containing protein n=1 Tax=Klebsiella pneumoniae TaxID=573 RepID=UPI003D7E161C